jgi:hypothetical protein
MIFCGATVDLRIFAMEVAHRTLPGGPRQFARTLNVPVTRVKREAAYRIAWIFGVDQSNGENE